MMQKGLVFLPFMRVSRVMDVFPMDGYREDRPGSTRHAMCRHDVKLGWGNGGSMDHACCCGIEERWRCFFSGIGGQ